MFWLLGSLIFFMTISSSSICLGQDDVADTGMSYRIPGEAESYPLEVKPGKRDFKDRSGMGIAFFSPGELVLTDPQGRRTGFDPLTNTSYDEIPQSNYVIYAREDAESGTEASDPMKSIYIHQPITGEYTLEVIGTGEGKYALEIDTRDIEFNPSNILVTDVPISTGIVHSYMLNYDKTVGAKIEIFGSYDVGGQRPRDVNKLLSYSNPTESRITLPAGTSTYPLMIFYGEAIVPSSFKAELNGVDITSWFSPTAGNSDIVNIDLQAGRNVLLLSIDGDGHATDRERLVFLVQ
jgi:hypothetical protein